MIIKAKTIEVGARLIEPKRRRRQQTRKNNNYKLCICLAANEFKVTPAAPTLNSSRQPERAGRLFAIASGLECSQFSDTFCNERPN